MTDDALSVDDLLDDEEEGFIDDGTADLDDLDSPLTSLDELQSRVRRFEELRTRRDQTKKAADDAKKEFEQYQAEFFAEYQASPLKGSVTVSLGDDRETQITPVRTHYGRIIDREAAEKYFAERAQQKEFIKEDFRMGRLHELVRECIEQKRPLPPGVDFYTKEYFRLTDKD